MLSRNSLVTSMMLVAGYIGICLVDSALVREYEDLAKVTKIISEDVKRERTNLQGFYFHTTRKKESWANHRDQHIKEVDFLMLLRTNQNLGSTPYGQNVLKKYNFRLNDFAPTEPHFAEIKINRAILKIISNNIDSLRATLDTKQKQRIRLFSQQEKYAIGDTHELDFQILSTLASDGQQYYYDIGQGPIPVESIPLMFPKRPHSLTLTMILKNVVTGEQQKYHTKVIP